MPCISGIGCGDSDGGSVGGGGGGFLDVIAVGVTERPIDSRADGGSSMPNPLKIAVSLSSGDIRLEG